MLATNKSLNGLDSAAVRRGLPPLRFSSIGIWHGCGELFIVSGFLRVLRFLPPRRTTESQQASICSFRFLWNQSKIKVFKQTWFIKRTLYHVNNIVHLDAKAVHCSNKLSVNGFSSGLSFIHLAMFSFSSTLIMHAAILGNFSMRCVNPIRSTKLYVTMSARDSCNRYYEPPRDKIQPVWSESSLSAWIKLGSLATLWAQEKTLIRLGGCLGWSESSLGGQILLVLSRGGSYFETQHDKTNTMICAPSEDSDQPGYPPSLLRFFVTRKKKPWVLSDP